MSNVGAMAAEVLEGILQMRWPTTLRIVLLLSTVLLLLWGPLNPLWAEGDRVDSQGDSRVEPTAEREDFVAEELRLVWRELSRLRALARTEPTLAGQSRLETVARRLQGLAVWIAQLEEQSSTRWARKHTELTHLVKALQEELMAGTLSLARPNRLAAAQGLRPQSLSLGSRCADAPMLILGSWSLRSGKASKSDGSNAEGSLAATGWLRFEAPFEGRFTLDTGRSSLDTHLELLADCAAPPLDQSDDVYGLAAVSSFRSAEGQTWWVRVESRGRGIAVLDVHGLASEVESHLNRAPSLGEKTAGLEELAKSFGPSVHFGSSTLSGRVTARADGAPLAGIRVELYRYSEGYWNYRGSDYSDGTGAYGFTGLSTGEYGVRTNVNVSNGDYLNQIYSDVDCIDVCDLGDGETIPLDGVGEVTGIDLSLLRGSTVSGWVLDEVAQLGIPSAWVGIYDASGAWIRADHTDSVGRYSLRGLGAGDYRLKVEHSEYRDELWQNVSCQGDCDVSNGDVLTLRPEQGIQGADFELIPLGSFSGRVTNELTGEPVQSATVAVYDPTGELLTYRYAEADGSFHSGGFSAGTYFLVVTSHSHVNEAWDDIPCRQGCEPTAATPVTITDNTAVTGLDFELEPYGSLTGVVTSATDGQPLSYFPVGVYDETGRLLDIELTMDDGSYGFALPAGSYYVAMSNLGSYYSEVWNDHRCADEECDVSVGDPVVLGAGSEVQNIDFSLSEKAIITGTINAPADGSTGRVDLYNSAGQQIESAYGNYSNGDYEFEGLEPGTYFAKASNDGYLSEVYDDVPCYSECDPTTGAALVVAEGQHLSGIDFTLDRMGRIYGVVSDQDTGLPLDSTVTRALLYDDQGDFRRSAYNEPEGSYHFSFLLPGTYFLLVTHSGYVDRLPTTVWDSSIKSGTVCRARTAPPTRGSAM